MALIQCPECGTMVSDQAANCPKCGMPIASNGPCRSVTPDEASGGLDALSFFFPVVGWVLWAIFKSDTPIKAKSCAKWAWIGFGVWVVINTIIYAVAFSSGY